MTLDPKVSAMPQALNQILSRLICEFLTPKLFAME